MPIYEYECEACEYELEVLQKISDPQLSECPSCGKDALRKRISAPSFRLKGGGWYETDFKTGNKRNLAGDGSGEKKAGDDKAKSGEAAPAKTGDAKAKPAKSEAKKSTGNGAD